jgi:hypothetical protein
MRGLGGSARPAWEALSQFWPWNGRCARSGPRFLPATGLQSSLAGADQRPAHVDDVAHSKEAGVVGDRQMTQMPGRHETVSFQAKRFDRARGATIYTLSLPDELASHASAASDLARLCALAADGRLDGQVELECSWRQPGLAIDALLNRRIGGKAVLHIDYRVSPGTARVATAHPGDRILMMPGSGSGFDVVDVEHAHRLSRAPATRPCHGALPQSRSTRRTAGSAAMRSQPSWPARRQ